MAENDGRRAAFPPGKRTAGAGKHTGRIGALTAVVGKRAAIGRSQDAQARPGQRALGRRAHQTPGQGVAPQRALELTGPTTETAVAPDEYAQSLTTPLSPTAHAADAASQKSGSTGCWKEAPNAQFMRLPGVLRLRRAAVRSSWTAGEREAYSHVSRHVLKALRPAPAPPRGRGRVAAAAVAAPVLSSRAVDSKTASKRRMARTLWTALILQETPDNPPTFLGPGALAQSWALSQPDSSRLAG